MAELRIKDVTDFLESWAPKSLQESYDNCGLLTGNSSDKVTGILTTLDTTEAVIDEALNSNCNLIVSHHPIIFKGLKKITGANYVERTVIKAIRHGIAIYAIHTNLDNVITGVNRKICERLGLINLKVLAPKTDTLTKLVTFIPKAETEKVMAELHAAGAGQIGNYKNCSFSVDGTGTFMPDEGANPSIGSLKMQESVEETRVEVVVPTYLTSAVLAALRKRHPYEEVAYYLTPLLNDNQEVGSGMVGDLAVPLEAKDFLNYVKDKMEIQVLRHTPMLSKPVEKVAVCGGAGSFLVRQAIQSGAQAYISADFKYHEFFDAEGRIIIADIGHYESEVYTKELLQEVLRKKFPTFAINFSRTVTNPISYL
jgi:dinuclear metal center YbgI/SA1388 family protein